MFALELTHDIDALLPLLIASAVAYGFTVVTMPRSILTEKISRRGHHIYREYGIDPLERHIVAEVMSREVETHRREPPSPTRCERTSARRSAIARFRCWSAARFIGMVDRETLPAGLRPARRRRAWPTCSAPTCRRWRCRTRTAASSRRGWPCMGSSACRWSPTRSRAALVGIVSRSDLIKPSLAIGEEEHVDRALLRTAAGRRAPDRAFASLTGGAADGREDA